jgi:hypothetical protein
MWEEEGTGDECNGLEVIMFLFDIIKCGNCLQ